MTLTGADIIIAKLSDDGTMLEGSTFMGGTDTDGFNLASATQYIMAIIQEVRSW